MTALLAVTSSCESSVSMKWRTRFCRVCGQPFRTSRLDAETCSDTCRARRLGGGDLAYLATLPPGQAGARQFVHEAHRDLIATHPCGRCVEARRPGSAA